MKLDDLHTTMAEQEATISALRLEVNKKNEQLGFITDEKVHLKPIRQSLCLIGKINLLSKDLQKDAQKLAQPVQYYPWLSDFNNGKESLAQNRYPWLECAGGGTGSS